MTTTIYDLFETNSGGLVIVDRKNGRGFSGFEIAQNKKANRDIPRNLYTFRSDTDSVNKYGHDCLDDGLSYTVVSRASIERLYEQLGQTDAAVLVARREDDEITILHDDIGTSARWYLAEDAPGFEPRNTYGVHYEDTEVQP